MTFDEYQQKAAEFAVYPKDREREYLSLGLISEVGELAGKLKKEIRDGVDLTEAILAEIGDCAWYGSQIVGSRSTLLHFTEPLNMSSATHASDYSLVREIVSDCLNNTQTLVTMARMLHLLHIICCRRGTTLEAVCEANIAKLTDRKNRGAIKGSGDNR